MQNQLKNTQNNASHLREAIVILDRTVLPPFFERIAKLNKKQFIKFIADQALGRDSEGGIGHLDNYNKLCNDLGKELVDACIKAYPLKGTNKLNNGGEIDNTYRRLLEMPKESAIDIIKSVLSSDSYYYFTDNTLDIISENSYNMFLFCFEHNESNPYSTKLGDKLIFKPDQKLINREPNYLNALIKYAAHFFTQKLIIFTKESNEGVEKRALDKSKSNHFSYLVESIINPDKKLTNAQKPNSVYYFKYFKEKDNTLVCFNLKIEDNTIIECVTFMPDKKEKWLEKQIAAGTYKDVSTATNDFLLLGDIKDSSNPNSNDDINYRIASKIEAKIDKLFESNKKKFLNGGEMSSIRYKNITGFGDFYSLSKDEVKKTFGSDFEQCFPIVNFKKMGNDIEIENAIGELKNGKSVVFDKDKSMWVEKYESGGVVVNDEGVANDGTKGGIFKGARHSEGGIPVKVHGGGFAEVEDGEPILIPESVNSGKKVNYKGQKMTTKEVVSAINQDAGGVPIKEKGGYVNYREIESSQQAVTVKPSSVIITRGAILDDGKYEFEGEMLTNKEILSRINEMGGGASFEDGGKIEDEEHKLNYYVVRLDTDDWSDTAYKGYDESKADSYFEDASIDELPERSKKYGGTATKEIYKVKFKYINEDEPIEDYPLEDYYDDTDYWEEIENGYENGDVDEFDTKDIVGTNALEEEEKEQAEKVLSNVVSLLKDDPNIIHYEKAGFFIRPSYYFIYKVSDTENVEIRVSNHSLNPSNIEGNPNIILDRSYVNRNKINEAISGLDENTYSIVATDFNDELVEIIKHKPKNRIAFFSAVIFAVENDTDGDFEDDTSPEIVYEEEQYNLSEISMSADDIYEEIVDRVKELADNNEGGTTFKKGGNIPNLPYNEDYKKTELAKLKALAKLQLGIEIEMYEHEKTLQSLSGNEISVNEAAKEIAETHLKEDSEYYENGGELKIGSKTNVGIIEDDYGNQYKVNGQWYHKSIVTKPPKDIDDRDFVYENVKSTLTFERGKGFVTLYHGTDAKSYESIIKSKKIGATGSITFFTSSKKEAKEYAENKSKYRGVSHGEILEVKVPKWAVKKNLATGEFETEFELQYNETSGDWTPTKESVYELNSVSVYSGGGEIEQDDVIVIDITQSQQSIDDEIIESQFGTTNLK